jgi:hypothetical protein
MQQQQQQGARFMYANKKRKRAKTLNLCRRSKNDLPERSVHNGMAGNEGQMWY